MSKPLHLLPVEEQDRIVLAVHSLAPRFATERRYGDQADDIIQEVSLRCLKSLRAGRWRVDSDRLRGVTRKLVRRAAIDLLKRDQRRTERQEEHARERFEGTPTWMSPELALDESELDAFQTRTLDELPESWRRPYLLVRQDREPYRAVAERLGVTRGAVHRSVAGVQRRFRDQLPDMGIYPPASGHGGRPRRATLRRVDAARTDDRKRQSTKRQPR